MAMHVAVGPTGRQKVPAALWLAVSASVVVHAAALLAPRLPWPDGEDGLTDPPVATVVRLRLVGPGGPGDAVGEPARAPEPAEAALPPAVQATAERPPTADSVLAPVPGVALPPNPVMPAEAGAPRAPSAPPVAVDPAHIVDGYVLRKALTAAPVPLGEVRLVWPAGSNVLDRQQAVFSLFIDDDGVVRRMVADGPTLAPLLEEAARDVFMATRFQPGQVDGRAVKALIRIEVVFDNSTPLAGAAPVPTVPRVVSSQNL